MNNSCDEWLVSIGLMSVQNATWEGEAPAERSYLLYAKCGETGTVGCRVALTNGPPLIVLL